MFNIILAVAYLGGIIPPHSTKKLVLAKEETWFGPLYVSISGPTDHGKFDPLHGILNMPLSTQDGYGMSAPSPVAYYSDQCQNRSLKVCMKSNDTEMVP